ncbi:Malic enzyme [Operophtera brumata]|uniref:Malic enzyme n=1 Tax=Operophtera brumata TaxID=104452 RepID=A0A0L7KXN4_OPEBR|nr:Malic enzyme [Operophtera brumata]
MSFTIEERQTLGIHGLLPAKVKSQDEQVQHCKLSIERYENPLNKYIYLMGLLILSVSNEVDREGERTPSSTVPGYEAKP